MNDKEKQIEELTNIIMTIQTIYHEKASSEQIAQGLVNAGYRKIPENAVVLTREEFDKLGLVVETVQKYESDEKGQPILVEEQKIVKKLRTDFTELLNQEIRELNLAQARKETAEKIYHKIKIKVLTEDMTEDRPQTLYRFTSFDIMKMARGIVEEFGVVVENGHVIIKE